MLIPISVIVTVCMAMAESFSLLYVGPSNGFSWACKFADDIDGLVQEKRTSIANALELHHC